MAHLLRLLQSAVLLLTITAFMSAAIADPYDPPANYYDSADGTGALLKQQLDDIMTSVHSLKTYGEARYILDDTDEDPSDPNNVLLTYNRISVSGTWVGNGAGIFGSREHVWPSSFRPDGSPSNGTTSIGSDLHMLKPLDPGTNSARDNRAFGFSTTTGANHQIGEDYYYPGDADRGDMARIMFYGATRWKDEGLDLINGAGNSSIYDMGDLASLIVWHFLDPPDDFELRRNHLIDGEQSNRNAYIDRPEYMWSVFVDQENDSQIAINGAAIAGDGSTSATIDLGRVLVGASVPASQSVTLDKLGSDGTYYEVTAAGDATSGITGRYNAFTTGGTDSTSFDVGLSTSTGTAGQRSGTVTIDNLDVTTDFGAGRGNNDADDTIDVALAVLDHAEASFVGVSELNTLNLDFGSVLLGSTSPTLDFDIFNLVGTVDFTADLEMDSFPGAGDTGVLTTDLTTFTGGSSLAAGLSNLFTATLDTSAVGAFAATYTLNFSDEDLPGAMALADLTLNLIGTVNVPEPASAVLVLLGFAWLGAVRNRGH